MITKIKICGITSLHDAMMSVKAGADYIGLIFIPNSPRSIKLSEADNIIKSLKSLKVKVKIVGLFKNSDLSSIKEVCSHINLDMIQLHGDESAEICKEMPLPVIKMLPILPNQDSELITSYLPLEKYNISHVLLEPPKEKEESVLLYEDSLKTMLNELKDPPYFLAGKLTSGNVGLTIQKFRPYAVDIASGIEEKPGIKDPKKLNAFCMAVHRYNESNENKRLNSCRH